jgi:hypothetical protein
MIRNELSVSNRLGSSLDIVENEEQELIITRNTVMKNGENGMTLLD